MMTKRLSLAAGVLFVARGVLWANPVPYEGQTANGDYTISTKDQLVLLANNVPSGGFSSSTFTLLNDIDMSAVSWTYPIGRVKGFGFWSDSAVPFCGTFDGGGYAIRNLSVNCTRSSGWGLFGFVQGANIPT